LFHWNVNPKRKVTPIQRCMSLTKCCVMKHSITVWSWHLYQNFWNSLNYCSVKYLWDFTWNYNARSFWRTELRHGTHFTVRKLTDHVARCWRNLKNRKTASDNWHINGVGAQDDTSSGLLLSVLWKIVLTSGILVSTWMKNEIYLYYTKRNNTSHLFENVNVVACTISTLSVRISESATISSWDDWAWIYWQKHYSGQC